MAATPDDEIRKIEVSIQEGFTVPIASQKEDPDQIGDSQDGQQVVGATSSGANPQEPKDLLEIQVMVAGLPGSGKSTSLNNLFDVSLDTKLSAKSVTISVQQKSTRKTIDKQPFNFTIFDTPGLRAIDINEKVVLHDIKKMGIKKGFLLIVTFQIYGKGPITQDFCNVLKNLTTIFGANVWDWSIILFTHSDTLSIMESSMETGHQECDDLLHESCSVLEKELRRHGVKKNIKLFNNFECEDSILQKDSDTIIALPVGRKCGTDVTKRLFPCTLWTHKYSWTDLAFMEIVNLHDTIPQASLKRSLMIHLRYAKFILSNKGNQILATGVTGSAAGTILGAFAGAGVGAFAGIAAGPGGILIGITAGAAIGLVAGLSITPGLAAAGSAAHHHYQISKEKKKTT